MSQNKTQATKTSVESYLQSIKDDNRRRDCERLLVLFEQLSGEKATMWGPGIVGFGQYHYRYDSGREGDFMRLGFAARSAYISVYIMPGLAPFEELLKKLGPHKKGKSCLNLKRLADIDETVLQQIVSDSLVIMAQKYPPDS